jgi:uncharacterized protein (DUF1697 family)
MTGGHRRVALLRGINVGRAKRIAMADLRAIVEGLGFTDARTLLNSGNVVFTGARGASAALARRIEHEVAARTGVETRVTVLAADELAEVIADNPFRGESIIASRLLVAFLREPETGISALAPLAREDWSPDAFAVGRRAAYLWCAGGILESRLSEAVGRALGDAVTTRNWATVTKLAALV